MIILHSIKILENLSEIEKLIQKIEIKMSENEVSVDREKLLRQLIEKSQQK